jgi:superoxide dismutase, Cu-Zn family
MFGKSMLAVLVFAAACGGDDEGSKMVAEAEIAGTGATAVDAYVLFAKVDGVVGVSVQVMAGPEGVHGVHIHQEPACGNAGNDAGGHWDGTATAGDPAGHGLPDGTTKHLGDLGNITVGADGTGTLATSNAGWTLGDGALTDVVGHSVILHMNADDGTMASAGTRLACGVITNNDT